MRDEERAMWRFSSQVRACLFNRELGLRSLNHGLLLHRKGVMHTLSDFVAGTVLTSVSCLTDCLRGAPADSLLAG